MPRVCMITGKKTVTGNHVSHSNRKTKRKWKANLKKKRIYLEDEKRFVTVKATARGLRTISKKGLKNALKDAGVKI